MAPIPDLRKPLRASLDVDPGQEQSTMAPQDRRMERGRRKFQTANTTWRTQLDLPRTFLLLLSLPSKRPRILGRVRHPTNRHRMSRLDHLILRFLPIHLRHPLGMESLQIRQRQRLLARTPTVKRVAKRNSGQNRRCGHSLASMACRPIHDFRRNIDANHRHLQKLLVRLHMARHRLPGRRYHTNP